MSIKDNLTGCHLLSAVPNDQEHGKTHIIGPVGIPARCQIRQRGKTWCHLFTSSAWIERFKRVWTKWYTRRTAINLSSPSSVKECLKMRAPLAHSNSLCSIEILGFLYAHLRPSATNTASPWSVWALQQFWITQSSRGWPCNSTQIFQRYYR